MGLEESLRQLDTSLSDGDFAVSIKFNRLERKFTDKDRLLVLYSDIIYRAENFEWGSTLPVVNIPYRDPALGFFLDGVIFSSVGVYSRAPGVVPDVEKRVLKEQTVEEPKIEIVTAKNSTIVIGYKRNAVQISFKRSNGESKVPIGIFLKALSGLPYEEILKNFKYTPQLLLHGFPCEIPKGGVDLSKVDTYGIESTEEPTIDECVNMVYSAITQRRVNSKDAQYTTHWKVNRINSLLSNLHFKSKQKYESTLSLGNRAIGTYLEEDVRVPYFSRKVERKTRVRPNGRVVDSDEVTESVEEYFLPKGHYVTADDAKEIRKYNISSLRVKTDKSMILQEHAPMFFRAKGYKLLEDLPEINAHAGDIIDDTLLDKINGTSRYYLDVLSPGGRISLHRSGENVELGDFYTILNYLFTHSNTAQSDASQYEISNRVIIDYDNQVRMEVEQVYGDIIAAVSGSTELKNLLKALPNLPSNRLRDYLRVGRPHEVVQSDITNIMSRAISEDKASAGMKETPVEMMPVQKGQYGRLDSFHSPDSDKVGSVQHRTVLSKLNENSGEIEAPYEEVVDGHCTGKIVYLTAEQENNKYIVAWNENLEDSVVTARYNDDITTVSREKVDYRDPSPFCDMSVSRMCIPFPGFSQAKRALMAAKMNGQAVPVLFPERPLVSTGADTEIPALYYTGRQILKDCGIEETKQTTIELVGREWKKHFVEYRFIYGNKTFTFSLPFTATDKDSLYYYNLNLIGGNTYSLDDIVFYHQCCDTKEYEYWTRINQGVLPLIKDYHRPSMALGVNLKVCFKTSGSSTVDDALLISDRLITDNTVSSIQIFKYTYQLRQKEFFYEVGWSAPLHSHVYAGQPLITAVKERDNREPSERTVLCKQEGEVVFAEINQSTGEAEVWVATLHQAEVGDKMAGRFGDKSVIAKIVPEYMMPYDPETGEIMDVIASPLSMPSRMNYGRILEVALGAVMSKEGKHAVVTPFYPNIKDDIVKLYDESGLKPRYLFNPEFGKMTERPVMTGTLYMLKLEQMANLKIKAVGYPRAVDPVFGQPIDSVNYSKGQAIGEMESWALSAAGSYKFLNALYTVYSDDELARKSWFDAMGLSEDSDVDPWDESFLSNPKHSTNKNALVTQTVMRMFGCDVEVRDNKYIIRPLDPRDISVRVSQQEFLNGQEKVSDTEWFTVPLSAPVVNPFWILNFPLHIALGVKSIKTLANGTAYLDLGHLNNRKDCIVSANNIPDYSKMRMITGVEAIIELLKNTTIDDAINRIRAEYGDRAEQSIIAATDEQGNTLQASVVGSLDNMDEVDTEMLDLENVSVTVADVIRFLQQMKREGKELRNLIWNEMPIMPRVFRQKNVIGNREQEHSFQTQLKAICASRATSSSIFSGLKDLIGYGTSKKSNLVSIRGYFFGKGSQAGNHGKVRGSVLSKRVGFSGRAVIAPWDDCTVSPFFIGMPWHLLMTQYGHILGMRLKKRNDYIARQISTNTDLQSEQCYLETRQWQMIAESLGEFSPYIFHQCFGENCSESDLYYIYNLLRDIVRDIVEGDVTNDGLVWYAPKGEYVDPTTLPDDATLECTTVLVGRQPTLHKRSLRVFFAKLVEGYTIRIHPIVCKGYNADFDGDTMYSVLAFGECKIESLKTISVMQDLISEKDGSYSLDLSQDVALGIYCASTFKDNSLTYTGERGNYYYFDDLAELKMQLEYGDLHYYDAVIYHCLESDSYYCSTAGRILLNASVPGYLTQVPFTDPHGICSAILGEEYIGMFKSLLHDEVWTTTSIRPKGRENAVKLDKVLLDTYDTYGARTSIMTAQHLYEIGVIASDIYSITMTLDDMSSNVDKQVYMEEPKKTAARLNDLYRMGLITDESRKMASVRAWDKAKKEAQNDIIDSLNPASNTFYMMYSGARGKPDQVMQSVGFIGNISKSKSEDIEYPILRGYGEGLSSLDLAQTRQSARIGVISTQAGTKDTGYATRQSVYMTPALDIREDDCGIKISAYPVKYATEAPKVLYSNGEVKEIESLLGRFVDSETEGFEFMRTELNNSGYMINESVLSIIAHSNLKTLKLLEETVEFTYSLDPEWRALISEEGYSYALPYTEGMKITEKTLDWIELMGMKEIILNSKEQVDTNVFDREAYLPVDYDTSNYRITLDDKQVAEETLYVLTVSESSENFYYYKNLLTENGELTEKAIRYLTKKRIHSIKFKSGEVASIKYFLSPLFKNVIAGRKSAGLPYLDDDQCITSETMNCIEELQLDYIPVRTGMTCLSVKGICSHCYGKSESTKQFLPVGRNLGIAASQAMCEPLSQATLNVAHAGGKRGSGSGLVSGLDYYRRMLKGSMVTERTRAMQEAFSEHEGYVIPSKHNPNFIQIVDKNNQIHTIELEDVERLNVPFGAYIDVNDTLVSGLPDFQRYSSKNIFDSALKTRYMLIKEYNKIFSALEVSARNSEVLARAQTSLCYAENPGVRQKVKDTSEEAKEPTGNYRLFVSSQQQVVSYYSGIASYAFENVASMLVQNVFTPEGLSLDSTLGNLITGTPVGSTDAVFINKQGEGSRNYKRSNVRAHTEALKSTEEAVPFTISIALTQGEITGGYATDSEEEFMRRLLAETPDALPGFDVESEPAQLTDGAEEELPKFEVDVIKADDSFAEDNVIDVDGFTFEEEVASVEEDKPIIEVKPLDEVKRPNRMNLKGE